MEIPARRGFSLTYRGKTLLSRIDPIGQAERIVGGLAVKDRTLYLCPSPLYGYGLSLFLEKMRAGDSGTQSRNNNSAVLCVETDEKLFNISQNAIRPFLDESEGRMILVKPGAEKESTEKLCTLVKNAWGERSFRRVEVLHLNGGWQLDADVYERIAAALNRDIAITWGNAMTLIHLGRLYIRNAIRNLPLIPKLADVSALDFGITPVLVLGAGPSADIMLNELGEFSATGPGGQRPFKIICADTCLPCLKERNIEPDLVVILESQHWNLRDFSDARNWKVAAAVDLSALPASTRILGGATFLFSTPWTELRFLHRLRQAGLLPSALTPLGSVGLSAAELALRLGSGPVVAAGLDFSFTLDAYHARCSPGHLARLTNMTRFTSPLNVEAAFREGTFTILSKSLFPVRSDPVLRNYRDLFEAEFSSSPRFFEIKGPGLSLGLKQLESKEAVRVLTGKEQYTGLIPAGTEGKNMVPPLLEVSKKTKLRLEQFIQNEKAYLLRLRDILTGEVVAEQLEQENLLDELDYLWAHFPDCAAAAGRNRSGAADLSFLKRVRAEIDPFLKLWDQALGENEQ